ncbi:hypothetical protein B0H19DRAFT_1089155 [Mycena capillaripes]|nr:hypothetical protein B0H19DRAFT_1089155 [Mycena capillaripes]
MLFKHKSSAAAVAYLISRIGALLSVLGYTIWALYPFKDCNKVFIAFNSFFPVGLIGSTFLIYHRVCAMYIGDRLITIIFGCLWLDFLGSSITIPLGEGASGVDSPRCASFPAPSHMSRL